MDGVQVVYPVHPNPNVREPVERLLKGCPRIVLIDPQDYEPFVFLMETLTSHRHQFRRRPGRGAVARQADPGDARITERPEAVDAGTVILVGTSRDRIVGEAGGCSRAAAIPAHGAGHEPLWRRHGGQANSDGHRGAAMLQSASLKSVCVLGLGYIGLPTASVIASRGVQVIGVDVKEDVVAKSTGRDPHRRARSRSGDRAYRAAGLRCAPRQHPKPADAFMIAVPTPFHDGAADLELSSGRPAVRSRRCPAARAIWSSWNRHRPRAPRTGWSSRWRRCGPI